MTKQEMIERLEKVKKLRFYEEMADFMNWKKYYEYSAEIEDLERKIKALD